MSADPARLPQLTTAFNVLASANEASGALSYPKYSSRVILVTTINARTPTAVANLVSEIAFRGNVSAHANPAVFGNVFILGPFVIIHAEGDHDHVLDFLKVVQPHVTRWPGIDQDHPIMLALKRRQERLRAAGQSMPPPLLGHCAVLLYEEEVNLMCNRWRIAICPTLPEGAIDDSVSFFDIVNRTTAAILRCIVLTHLNNTKSESFVPGTDFNAATTQILIKFMHEMPTYAFLKKIVAGAAEFSYTAAGSVINAPEIKIDAYTPFSAGNLEKWQIYDGTVELLLDDSYDTRIQGERYDVVMEVNAKHRKFMAEAGTIFDANKIVDDNGEQLQELFSLDEFILEFVYVSPERNVEDSVYNMNENWLFDNLRHLLQE